MLGNGRNIHWYHFKVYLAGLYLVIVEYIVYDR